MKKSKNREIIENIAWFKKFNLVKRLTLSFSQQEAVKILRGLKIEGFKKST
ncbi:MAG: hypothetical protein WCW67_05825 [Candidatus Margulisiibacteriota bacterium]|jgi:hypothetical protein